MCLASIVMTEVESSAIVDFATGAAETTHSKPPVERLLAGDPQQVARNYFSDSGGRFFAGVWESTPGKWRVRYSENEFCHITRGRIRIEDSAGRQWSFKAGDSFFFPAAFAGNWEVIEATAALSATYGPEA